MCLWVQFELTFRFKSDIKHGVVYWYLPELPSPASFFLSLSLRGGLPQGKRENNSLSNFLCQPEGDRRATVSFCWCRGDLNPWINECKYCFNRCLLGHSPGVRATHLSAQQTTQRAPGAGARPCSPLPTAFNYRWWLHSIRALFFFSPHTHSPHVMLFFLCYMSAYVYISYSHVRSKPESVVVACLRTPSVLAGDALLPAAFFLQQSPLFLLPKISFYWHVI